MAKPARRKPTFKEIDRLQMDCDRAIREATSLRVQLDEANRKNGELTAKLALAAQANKLNEDAAVLRIKTLEKQAAALEGAQRRIDQLLGIVATLSGKEAPHGA